MGCGIHCFKEKRVGGKWVTADKWTPYDYGDGEKGLEVRWEDRFTKRNYQLFGLLCRGVRVDNEHGFAPRGLPADVCQEIRDESESWGGDGHNHSYLYLHEIVDLAEFLKHNTIKVTGMKDAEGLKNLRESIASGAPNWDLLFPYCQYSNAPNAEEFEVAVPGDFYVGDNLRELIGTFDGLDGDNHRLVFFFDN